MGKRSSFKRRQRDFYATPYEAVGPLLPFLRPCTRFAEPCCGEMDLVNHLTGHGHVCTFAGDISKGQDAREFKAVDCEAIITNPPWSRPILHELIASFSSQRPTWLLFDADWAFTKQSTFLMAFCRAIVPVGRLKWIPDSKYTGKDNAAWYLFDKEAQGSAHFYARAA